MYIQRAVLVIARGLSYILSALHSVFYTMSCCKHLHSYGKSQGNVPYFSRLVTSELTCNLSEEICLPIVVLTPAVWVCTPSSCGRIPPTLDHWWCLWSCFTATIHELCVIMHTTAITIAMASSVAATEMVFLNWLCVLHYILISLYCQLSKLRLMFLLLWGWSQLDGQISSCGFLSLILEDLTIPDTVLPSS